MFRVRWPDSFSWQLLAFCVAMIVLANSVSIKYPFGYSPGPRMQNLHSFFSWRLFAQYFVDAFFEQSFAKSESHWHLVFCRCLHFPRYVLLVLHLHDSISLPSEHIDGLVHIHTPTCENLSSLCGVN